MSEWLKEHAWKACVGETLPWVRIPLSPPSASARVPQGERLISPSNVTSHDYNLVMSDVRIADLKARLSEHLRSVRNGSTVTVFDRDTPVARIVPYAPQPLEIRKAKRRLRDLKLPPKPSKRTDSLAILAEDRRRR